MWDRISAVCYMKSSEGPCHCLRVTVCQCSGNYTARPEGEAMCPHSPGNNNEEAEGERQCLDAGSLKMWKDIGDLRNCTKAWGTLLSL